MTERFSNDDLIQMYKIMLQARLSEELAVDLNRRGRISGLHPGIGYEALGVGVGYRFSPSDYIAGAYRAAHVIQLATGAMTVKDRVATLMGKVPTGQAKGRVRFLRGTGLVGSGIPIAVGQAMADKLSGSGSVTLCFMGDGATNRGDFHEGLNLAAAWKLPIVFGIQNNQYSISVPIRSVTAIDDLAVRASAYGFPGVVVNGNDVFEVYEVTYHALQRARQGDGPTLIEYKVDRWTGHVVNDPDHYRSEEFKAEMRARCPVERMRRELLRREVLTEREADELRQAVQQEVEEALTYAEQAPSADREWTREEILGLVYA